LSTGDLRTSLQNLVSGTVTVVSCDTTPASEADPNVLNERTCLVTVTPASDASLIKTAVNSNQGVAGIFAAADASPSSAPPPPSDGFPIAAVIGGVAGGIVLIIAVVAFVVYKKRSSSSRAGYYGEDNYMPLHIPGQEGGDMNIRMDDV
jgi:hypothetical protein